jgi:hypothetical protein
VRLLAIVAALGAAAGTAAAQPESHKPDGPGVPWNMHKKGRELAKQWRQDGDRKKLEEAARLFKEAYKLGGQPLAECDLGLALHYLGEDSRAQVRLNSCMPRLAAEGADKVAAYRGIADEVASALRTGYVSVDIVSTPPGAIVTLSSFPPDETVLAPTLVWLKPGNHTFVAHLDGHVDASFSVDITDAEAADHVRKEWRVTLEPIHGTNDDKKEPDLIVPVTVDTPAPRSRTSAYATLGVGGALLAGGAVVHVLGRSVRSDLSMLSGDAYDEKLGTWHVYQRATIGLYATGAITTGIGLWLYTKAKTPAPIAVTPASEGAGAMVWLFSTH